jgi:hypothetical protein
LKNEQTFDIFNNAASGCGLLSAEGLFYAIAEGDKEL